MRRALYLFSFFLIATGVIGTAYWRSEAPAQAQANVADASAAYKTPQEASDVYVRFVMEAYDTIQQAYWQKASDKDLSSLFDLSIQKAENASSTPAAADRSGVASELAAALDQQKTDDAKKNLALTILQVALYNLAPQGRDEVLTSQAQAQLQQTVANVNPSANLYGDLGVTASSSPQQIQAAYAAKESELAASSSPAAQQQLAHASYAHDVLSNADDRIRYDSTGAQPTVFAHVIGTTLYLDLGQMSPDTAGDFAAALDAASTTPLSSMIIDLRGNIGGSLEQVPNMLGYFLGKQSYVFDLYEQGDLKPIRSPMDTLPELSRYKEIAVLSDSGSKSSAEVLTAAMKRFHLATVVGETTGGWGTVENTYPLKTAIDPNTTYALLLVYAITLSDDNQPIQGTGVAPDVSVKTAGWQSELPRYFRSESIISAIQEMEARDPWK